MQFEINVENRGFSHGFFVKKAFTQVWKAIEEKTYHQK